MFCDIMIREGDWQLQRWAWTEEATEAGGW